VSKIVYQSVPDHNNSVTCWREEGELPQCVDTLRIGDFLCECGKHRVQAYVVPDPIDSQDRISRKVALV